MNFYEYPITSNYGTRTDPFTKQTKSHKGIDYGLPYNTQVKSNIEGIVSKVAYDKSGYGNYVIVKDSTGRLHTYAHLTKATVNVGDSISINEILGLSGSTGRSTGAHLHYEVTDSNGTNLNPTDFTRLSLSEHLDEIHEKVDDMEAWRKGTIFDTGDIKPIEPISIKDKLKNVVFNIFKFIIIALLIILCIVFLTKSLDIEII